jgi:hypothetical protein
MSNPFSDGPLESSSWTKPIRQDVDAGEWPGNHHRSTRAGARRQISRVCPTGGSCDARTVADLDGESGPGPGGPRISVRWENFGDRRRDVGDGFESLSGYSIVEAGDLNEAAALADGHPFLSEGLGKYAIDLFELNARPIRGVGPQA